MKRQSKPRIDSLQRGQFVHLSLQSSFEPGYWSLEPVRFLGIYGTGDGRQARFAQQDDDGRWYQWECYRYKGRWVWGSSAGNVRLTAWEAAGPRFAGDTRALMTVRDMQEVGLDAAC
jgi:hypothetical protein